MKTIIFNGSPRKKGDTSVLIDTFCKEMQGEEIKIVNAYRDNIHPCVDCRWCFENSGCAIQDDMQEIFSYLEECDHIVIASPVYFGELTGMLLALFSRFQTYFSAKYVRKTEPVKKKKTGAIFLCAGSFGPREKAESTADMLLNLLNCQKLDTVYIDKTDQLPAIEQKEALKKVCELARQMKGDR